MTFQTPHFNRLWVFCLFYIFVETIRDMKKHTQIVKMNKSILEYFRMVMDFDNQSKEYREVTEKEFIDELTKSLNCGVGNKEIVWV